MRIIKSSKQSSLFKRGIYYHKGMYLFANQAISRPKKIVKTFKELIKKIKKEKRIGKYLESIVSYFNLINDLLSFLSHF